eukprot:s62_g21.t2
MTVGNLFSGPKTTPEALSSQPCLRFVGLKSLDEVYDLVSAADGLLGVRSDGHGEAVAFVERGALGASLFRRLTGQDPGADLVPVRTHSAWGQPSPGATRLRVKLEQTLTSGSRTAAPRPKPQLDAWESKEEVPDTWEDMLWLSQSPVQFLARQKKSQVSVTPESVPKKLGSATQPARDSSSHFKEIAEMTIQEEIFFPIRELSTYQGTKWTIKGRVTTRAPMRDFKQRNGGEGKVFSVELLDAEGGEIRASFFNEAAEKLYSLMQVGKCFKLSKGNVRIANRQYNTCKHRYELVFDKLAQVDEVEDDKKIDAVKYGIENLRSVKGKTLPCSVDICGILISYEQPIAFESKDGRKLVKRNIIVADDTGMSMTVTLWAERAEKDDSAFSGSPVVAMKGVMVKEWQGGLSGSLTEGGKLDLHPDLPEAKRVLEWWKTSGHAQDLTFISQTTGSPGPRVSGKILDVMEMKQACEQVVTEQQTYSVYCRLAAVQTRKRDEVQPLYYTACLEPKEGIMQGRTLPCNRRVDENEFCAVCQKKGKVGPRLNLRCKFEDASGNCWVTAFHPAAEKVLSLTAQEVQEIEQKQGREAIENRLKDAYYGEMLQIHLRAKPEMYNGETRTGVSCIAASLATVRDHSRFMLKEIEEMLAK